MGVRLTQLSFTDGGFDDAISKLLSPSTDYFFLTRFVQLELYGRRRGFIPPGSATILRLPDDVVNAQKDTTGCKYIAVCPTMHRPHNISWNRDVVYNVVWSLLAEVDGLNTKAGANTQNSIQIAEHEMMQYTEKPPIRSVLLPGLGTGTGEIPYARFATQFALAAKNFDEAIRMPEKWSCLEWEDVDQIAECLEGTWPLQ
ncbi:hypothetical protein EW145_g7379 [Phellinidium pouzarii]|uniref:Macro-like domain-containing protein n=1 Tax=Phellinidium pouzarii TaxID=167371 RepID=A0A4S4KLV2_9AGAM|nr:hypothetical protein EW145_g7379 [Phellinidium pouzarii]